MTPVADRLARHAPRPGTFRRGRIRYAVACLIAAAGGAPAAWAAQADDPRLPPLGNPAVPECRTRSQDNPAWMKLRIENDVVGGQDRGYTAGGFVEYQSPDLGTAEEGNCLGPGFTAGLDGALRWLRPALAYPGAAGSNGAGAGLSALSHRTLRLSLGQTLYTPNDYALSEPIPTDRPFAAALAMGLTYNASLMNTMWTTGLQLGVIGPSAGGKWSQSTIHRLWRRAFDMKQPQGWHNQLHDELLAQIHHEQLHRIDWRRSAGQWPIDTIVHYGANVGTAFRYIDVGLEWRTGPTLPADFGTSPVRPAGDITGAPRANGGQADGWNLFASTGVKWVQHDITLDGNTDGNSMSIRKRPAVFEFGVGITVHDGPWRVTFGQYARSFEFHGQQQWPVYGSLAISRALAW